MIIHPNMKLEDILSKDKPLSSSHMYSIAEHLFKFGRKKDAVPFFRYVVNHEQECDHEQFIMSQYRLFLALIGIGAEENKEALLRFESYYNQLPEHIRLDAILQMANVYYTFWDWDKVESYADELHTLAKKRYDQKLRNDHFEDGQTERHLVVYYGQGFLLKGIALTMQGKYEEAKPYVKEYSDLGWFKFLNETGGREVEKFRIWGKGNMYTLELMTGNKNVLHDFSKFLDEHPEYTLPYMLSIMEAANKFNLLVDEIIERFCQRIPPLNSSITYINGTQLFHYWYEKSIYSFNNGKIGDGINELLYALYLSRKMQYYSGFERCIPLFEEHDENATEKQKREYKNILNGVSER
ncbi:DNA-binding protein [Paenibacillus elgii]